MFQIYILYLKILKSAYYDTVICKYLKCEGLCIFKMRMFVFMQNPWVTINPTYTSLKSNMTWFAPTMRSCTPKMAWFNPWMGLCTSKKAWFTPTMTSWSPSMAWFGPIMTSFIVKHEVFKPIVGVNDPMLILSYVKFDVWYPKDGVPNAKYGVWRLFHLRSCGWNIDSSCAVEKLSRLGNFGSVAYGAAIVLYLANSCNKKDPITDPENKNLCTHCTGLQGWRQGVL